MKPFAGALNILSDTEGDVVPVTLAVADVPSDGISFDFSSLQGSRGALFGAIKGITIDATASNIASPLGTIYFPELNITRNINGGVSQVIKIPGIAKRAVFTPSNWSSGKITLVFWNTSPPNEVQSPINIGIAAGSSVEISGTPSINIAAGNTIGLTAGTSVEISGTPTINLGSGATVEISGTPTFELKSGSEIFVTNDPVITQAQPNTLYHQAHLGMDATGTVIVIPVITGVQHVITAFRLYVQNLTAIGQCDITLQDSSENNVTLITYESISDKDYIVISNVTGLNRFLSRGANLQMTVTNTTLTNGIIHAEVWHWSN